MARIDIVTILDTIATTQGYGFSYGNTANQNVLNQELDTGKFYLLLDQPTRADDSSAFGFDGGVTYSGNMMLVLLADLDTVQFSKDTSNLGKYQQYTSLCLAEARILKSKLSCTYEIGTWSVLDINDALDENLSGVIITYSIKDV